MKSPSNIQSLRRTRHMQVAYRKMHGTGNVILVVDQRADNLSPPTPEKLRELGDSSSGPGFDQMMWVYPADDGHSIARYRVFNADGSEVEQCGNGVRCVARYLAGNNGRAQSFSLQSPAGAIDARVQSDGWVAVSMGAPVFDPAAIPFLAHETAKRYTIALADDAIDISAVSMGNPHCVVQVDSVEDAAVSEIGPQIEHHERFPASTNVGFMQIRDCGSIDLRVHERGVGETQACGTGACAAVVVGRRLGLLDADVRVNLPGGQVMVSWRGGGDPVWLTGNAEASSDGTMDV